MSEPDCQSFSSLPLPEAMLTNLSDMGYRDMTAIQSQALPPVLEGKDVIAQAKTGSGKTAAFGLGALLKLNQKHFAVQALVLCPTRELANQVSSQLRTLARCFANIKVLTLGGGVAIGPQIGSLAHGAHIIVGTPGRVLKHLDKGTLTLDALKVLVLDEADRMLDMGFYDDIQTLIEKTPVSRQTLLFSATYSDQIRALSKKFLRTPVEVKAASLHSARHIEQRSYQVEDNTRDTAVATLLQHFQPESALVFCNTKTKCADLARALRRLGLSTQALHGDLEQRQRDEVMLQFANKSCRYLVATDVAARGLDVEALAAVVNVELAFEPEVHIHRIGRTARAGQQGLVFNLCAPSELVRARAIETYQAHDMQWHDLPAAMDDLAEMPPPIMSTIAIAGGKKDKLRPGDILGALTKDAGLPGDGIGKIDSLPLQTYVAVKSGLAKRALQYMQRGKIKGRTFKARLL